VHKFKFQQQVGTGLYIFIDGRHDLNGVEKIPLATAEVHRIAAELQGIVDAFAISSYAGPANSSHEARAAEIVSEISALPVVQAHHLSSELDSIRRATTASLNASLLSNLHELLDAVQEMLAKKGVHCPTMMVRGDGSIVGDQFARSRPVEMIHSGPATSAIGGQYLAGINTALVIDVGGTTTDIALVDRGSVQLQENAATVGSFRTCVKTIKARSFGLGGDSLIAFDHRRNLSIGPDRVVPISRLCSLYPQIKHELLGRLRQKQELLYSDQLEYWILRREPKRPVEIKIVGMIIESLRKEPQSGRDLKKRVGPIAPFLIRELVDLEIIDRSGLTPTDLLHVTGEFMPWDRESAEWVTKLAARNWDESAASFIQRVRKAMAHRIVAEIIQFLSEKPLSQPGYWKNNHSLDRWLYDESLFKQDAYLGCNIFLKTPIVGIGAPAKSFLPQVADALGTSVTFPEHYEVANAVGTVVGNVIIQHEGEVFPCVEGSAITGYFARAARMQQKFSGFDQAVAFAREMLTQQVASDIELAGAEPARVEFKEEKIWEGMARLAAWAVGKPGLDGKAGDNYKNR
jgi:N-methylhydantoinase A/oxoprolinase/acetone carboxylase beta subunit